MMIETASVLAEYCQKAAIAPWLALDTEFNRTTTYWAELCLIQVNSPVAGIATIDPLVIAPADLTPFWELLGNDTVVKILHSARQDIEIFMVLANVIPKPLFDTQVAAAALGYGDQIGYDRLVKGITGATIDKTSRFTDWTRRPLRKEQREYALEDVRHLPALYENLHGRLEQRGRLAWIAGEMAILENPATYQPAPEDAWRKIKARGGSAAFQGRLHVLAAWREDEAIRRNYNRTRVMRDETILKLAAEPPASADDIRRFPGIGKPAIETADQLYAAIRSAQPMRSPPPPPWASHPLPAIDLLKLLLRIRCQQEDVAEKLVASSDDLDKLAWYAGTADIPALKGWRREVFGNDALALMEGKLSLTYDAGEKRVKLSG